MNGKLLQIGDLGAERTRTAVSDRSGVSAANTPVPWLDDGDVRLCACGCNERVVSPDAKGRSRKFRRGHNLRVDHPLHRPGVENWWTGRRHSPESVAKIAAAASRPKPWISGERNGMASRRGQLNPNYKDGSSPERQRLYASGEWNAIASKVYARDKGRCVRCGKAKQGPRSLHVHHVKPWAEYPERRFELDNLITLCRGCHHEAHRKEVKP